MGTNIPASEKDIILFESGEWCYRFEIDLMDFDGNPELAIPESVAEILRSSKTSIKTIGPSVHIIDLTQFPYTSIWTVNPNVD